MKNIPSTAQEHEIKVGMVRICDIIFILGTRGWQKIKSNMTVYNKELSEDPLGTVDRLVEQFRVPIEAANAHLNEILHEFKLIWSYSGQFISLSILDYQSFW